MPRTLYARLALALAGLLSAAFTLFATQRYLEEVNQRFNWDLAEHLVADRNLVKQGRIDRKALKETFDRFYQAPGKRGRQRMGLGLAIAKRILELHGSRIEVTSALSAGACFSFASPLWSA